MWVRERLQIISLIGRGDFNGDGKEDLMIDFIDQAKNGNYFSHIPFFWSTVCAQKAKQQ